LDEKEFLEMLTKQLMSYDVAGNTAPGSIVENPESHQEDSSEEN
jgi:hypothetical protein